MLRLWIASGAMGRVAGSGALLYLATVTALALTFTALHWCTICLYASIRRLGVMLAARVPRLLAALESIPREEYWAPRLKLL